MSLQNLDNDQLLVKTELAVRTERNSTADVIKHFQEIARRRLYLEMGYSSMFAMLREKYGYCEPSAQLRINAVRLIDDVPEVEAKL